MSFAPSSAMKSGTFSWVRFPAIVAVGTLEPGAKIWTLLRFVSVTYTFRAASTATPLGVLKTPLIRNVGAMLPLPFAGNSRTLALPLLATYIVPLLSTAIPIGWLMRVLAPWTRRAWLQLPQFAFWPNTSTELFVKSVMNIAPLEEGGGGGTDPVDELLQPVAARTASATVAAVTGRMANRCDFMAGLLCTRPHRGEGRLIFCGRSSRTRRSLVILR